MAKVFKNLLLVLIPHTLFLRGCNTLLSLLLTLFLSHLFIEYSPPPPYGTFFIDSFFLLRERSTLSVRGSSRAALLCFFSNYEWKRRQRGRVRETSRPLPGNYTFCPLPLIPLPVGPTSREALTTILSFFYFYPR